MVLEVAKRVCPGVQWKASGPDQVLGWVGPYAVYVCVVGRSMGVRVLDNGKQFFRQVGSVGGAAGLMEDAFKATGRRLAQAQLALLKAQGDNTPDEPGPQMEAA